MEKAEILKKCREYNNSNDILYYLIRQKRSDAYAVIHVPCNYLYRNDENQFFGTCIYVSENNVSEAMRPDFPTRKRLCGIPMVKICERTDSQGVHSLTNPEIRQLPFRHRIDSDPRFSSAFISAYTCFECEDVVGITEPKAALADLCRRNSDARSFTSALADRFGISPEQIGITGSAALGAERRGDYDVIFYGSPDELRRISGIIADINRKQGTPKIGGMPLPFRMIFQGNIVDVLYVYDSLTLDGIHSARQIRTDVAFRCRVTDDTLVLQSQPFLKVDSEDFSSLFLAESFFHSVLKKGDVIEGRGELLRWEHDGKSEDIMFCKTPLVQLKNWPQYFYRYE